MAAVHSVEATTPSGLVTTTSVVCTWKVLNGSIHTWPCQSLRAGRLCRTPMLLNDTRCAPDTQMGAVPPCPQSRPAGHQGPPGTEGEPSPRLGLKSWHPPAKLLRQGGGGAGAGFVGVGWVRVAGGVGWPLRSGAVQGEQAAPPCLIKGRESSCLPNSSYYF